MFLSDELIAIGRESNPKNNLSQYEAAKKMLVKLQEHKEKNPELGIKWFTNTINFAFAKLQKEGFSFFRKGIITFQ